MDEANNDTRGRSKCLATLRKKRQRSEETDSDQMYVYPDLTL